MSDGATSNPSGATTDSPDSDGEASGMTIDELSERTGVSIRTLRLYQTKSILPPPRVVGRVGYYSDTHVARLLTIGRLQERGFSLAGIAEVVRMWEQGQGIDELLGFERVLATPWSDEQPVRVSPEELLAKFPGFADEKLLSSAIDAGVVERRDGGYTIPSMNLLEFGTALVERGVPPEVAIEQLLELQKDVGRIAERFLALFRRHILPSMTSEDPMNWLPNLAKFSKRYRPAMRTLVVSAFTRAMDREVGLATHEVMKMADS